jgi:hypothetical protein
MAGRKDVCNETFKQLPKVAELLPRVVGPVPFVPSQRVLPG